MGDRSEMMRRRWAEPGYRDRLRLAHGVGLSVELVRRLAAKGDLSLQQIADRLGISKQRVHQICRAHKIEWWRPSQSP